MYIFKNAFLNITRCRGRNILMAIIITVITIGSCVSLSIYHSGNNLVENYKNENPIEVSFQLDSRNFRDMSDEDRESFTTMNVDDVINYGNSSLVLDYYYTLESMLASDDIAAVNYNEMFKPSDEEDVKENNQNRPAGMMQQGVGDFRITAYSNSTYIEDFINGVRKITDGEMVGNDSANYSLVMSEELAEDNELAVGDTVTFISASDEDITYEFKIIGLFSDDNEVEENSFMNMNVMNTRNQMFTTMNTLLLMKEDEESDNIFSSGLTATFYLESSDDLSAFEMEVREKGLSDYYQVSTNEDSVLQTLKPIQNITNFSFVFLIVILIVGAIILIILHMINIRDRKYEIGVLRAIGMSKGKVSTQLISEILFVSLVALLLGSLIGSFLSQPITNHMLQSEIDSYTEKKEATEENFGRPGMMNRDDLTNPFMNTNYIDNLEVSFDLETMLQLFGISLLLTILSGVVSTLFVNRYEPNKILQNRV